MSESDKDDRQEELPQEDDRQGNDQPGDVRSRTGDWRADDSLTKSGLIDSLARNQSHLPPRDVELAVKSLLERMSREMANGERIEIRGFGSFSLHFREPRIGRNPKSGDAVALRGKHVPHFKPGKELRERVNGDRDGPTGRDAPSTEPGASSSTTDGTAS